MILPLTRRPRLATKPRMIDTCRKLQPGARLAKRMMPRVLVAALMASALAGCITLKAPDKPIVIELNINIKQEVIYRLAADAGKTIDSNKDIF
jgi:hypothetical protein